MGTYAEVPIGKVDFAKVGKIESFLHTHPDILKALDNWVLIANYELIEELKELRVFLKKIKNYTIHIPTLYRGVRTSQFGNNLGSDKVALGQTFKYSDKTTALSFTTDLQIARDFGHIVLRLDDYKGDYLELTDELMMVLNKHRNITTMNIQKEVIVFPPMDLNILVYEKKSPGWLGW